MASVAEQINRLRAEADHSSDDLRRAAQLEARGARLRESAPKRVDRGIYRATEQLLKDYEAGSLSPRDALEATLDINQFKPSRVIRGRAPNKLKILKTFDLISREGTPVIDPPSDVIGAMHSHPITGLTTNTGLEVKVGIAQGMGELPDATITFGISELVRDFDDLSRFDRADRQLSRSAIHSMGSLVAGAEAITEYFNGLEVWSKPLTCGHGFRTNASEVYDVQDKARHLASLAGFSLGKPLNA